MTRTIWTFRCAALLGVLLATAACSTGDGGVTDPPGGGGGGAGGDGGSGTATTAGKGLVSASTQQAHDTLTSGETHYTTFSALLLDTATPAAACVPTVAKGACKVASCGITVPTTDPTSLDLGMVTVTGSSRTATLAAPTYHDDGFDPSKFFSPGETITFDVAGGHGVPHHTGTVVAPKQITIDTSFPAELDRTQDLSFTFSGGDLGKLVVSFEQNVGDGFSITRNVASCTFDASSGEGVIPAAALDIFNTPGEYTHGQWYARGQNDSDVVLGPWTTTFRSDVDAILPDGNAATATFDVP